MAIGRSDEYRFDVYSEDRVVRVRRAWSPQPVQPDERTNWRTALRRVEAATGQSFPIPDTKPAFRRLLVGDAGRVWVERYVVAHRLHSNCFGRTPLCWVESPTFDIFGAEGEYDGTVRLAVRTTILSVRADTLWVAERGALHQVELVQYAIEPG